MLQGQNATSSADLTGRGHTAVKDATGGLNEIASSPTGYVGGSWLYHGTTVIDRLVVQNSADLQFTAAQSFSLVAWVNPTTLQGFSGPGTTKGYDGASIVVKSRDTGAYYGLWINLPVSGRRADHRVCSPDRRPAPAAGHTLLWCRTAPTTSATST